VWWGTRQNERLYYDRTGGTRGEIDFEIPEALVEVTINAATKYRQLVESTIPEAKKRGKIVYLIYDPKQTPKNGLRELRKNLAIYGHRVKIFPIGY